MANGVNCLQFVPELTIFLIHVAPPRHNLVKKFFPAAGSKEVPRPLCFPPPSQEVVTVGEVANALGVPGVEASEALKR